MYSMMSITASNASGTDSTCKLNTKTNGSRVSIRLVKDDNFIPWKIHALMPKMQLLYRTEFFTPESSTVIICMSLHARNRILAILRQFVDRVTKLRVSNILDTFFIVGLQSVTVAQIHVSVLTKVDPCKKNLLLEFTVLCLHEWIHCLQWFHGKGFIFWNFAVISAGVTEP